MLKADLHIHTVASGHGYCTWTENAEAAVKKGMELIAFTDHGPHVPEGAHPWYFWDLKVTPSVYKGMRVLNGCEANIVNDSETGLDLPNDLLEALDFVEVGFHSLCGFDGKDRARNTDAVVQVLENPFVDQLNHPGNDERYPLDLEQVIVAAKKNNVIIELNNHSFDPHGSRGGTHEREKEFARAAFEANIPIAVGSDSHYFNTIGIFDDALAAADEIGIPHDYFVNRDAQSVINHLEAKRPRTRINWGPIIS